MKELARFLARNRVAVRSQKSPDRPERARKGSRTFLSPEDVERPPETETGAQSVYRVPDSWDIAPAPTKLKDHAAAQSTQEEGPEKKPLPRKPERKKKNSRKSRRINMSFSVSPEEEDILRAHAYKHGVSFSEWARTSLFAAMQKQIPARHN